MDTPRRIVVVGAGYAGLHATLGLSKRLMLHKTPAQVTLIDQHDYHQHVALLHRVAASALREQQSVVPIDTIVQGRPVQRYEGVVCRVDPLERVVVLEQGDTLPYDRLLIACGAHADDEGAPGTQEHTLSLRTFADAVHLRDHIVACFRAAAQERDPVARRILLTVAVVGGGFVGCQFAGELAAQASFLAQRLGVPRSEVRIALLESSDHLLGQVGGWADREARRVLDHRRVSIYFDTAVERVEERALFVSGDRVLRAATIVWTTGIRAPSWLAESGLPTNDRGQVKVDRYLRVQDQACIFAAGDCAAIPDPSGGTVVATASYALRQGEHLGDTLAAEVEGRAPRMYEPLRLGHVVSLGPGRAIGDPLGVPISGRLASFLKDGIEQWYFSTLE